MPRVMTNNDRVATGCRSLISSQCIWSGLHHGRACQATTTLSHGSTLTVTQNHSVTRDILINWEEQGCCLTLIRKYSTQTLIILLAKIPTTSSVVTDFQWGQT
ncbi:hypothetical protein BaRGS_00010896 [Batillaria attramentaria]|uniref:Uncharacterized protein n=1 Tax=Batillaria attramentaria TaxID=370345 RepID=A0ABD0LDY2_9CAEN